MADYTPEFKEDGTPGSAGATDCFREEYIANPKPAVPTAARETTMEQQSSGKAGTPVGEASGQQADAAKPAGPTKANDKSAVKGEAKTTTTLDGMTRTVQEMKDGSVVIKTHPPYYPKDGHQIEHWKARDISRGKGVEGFLEVRISDSENVRKQALEEQTELERERHFHGSRNGDKYPRGEIRNLTLAEARTLKDILPKFPADPKRGINIYFFDGWNVLSDRTNSFHNPRENLIGVNPRASRETMLQGDRRYMRGKDKALAVSIAHEMSHDFTYRLDPKGYRDGSLEIKLGKIFGMKIAEEDIAKTKQADQKKGGDDAAKHKRIWLVEGEELVDGKKQTFYYKPTGNGYEAIRCDNSANPVDKSGKPVDPKKAIVPDINSVAKIKLPSSYAYHNPKDAAAEVWVFYGINEASRAYLRETVPEEVYRWVEESDQKIINMVKADEPNPDGWIRIPSGDIKPGDKSNKELVLAFMQKHSPKKDNK